MTGPHRVPVFVNPAEHRADDLLQRTAEANGDRLLAKVRLADALDVGDWGNPHRDFAMRAHLDFLMISAATAEPIFAVEIDGARHRTDQVQRRRDLLKDELCREAGLPLLRVGSDFARREGRVVLLDYLCEAYYRSVAFEAAQEAGHIPWDEPFIHWSFVEADPDTGRLSLSGLDMRARAELQWLCDQKRIPHFVPDTWGGEVDQWGDLRSEVYLGVGKGLTLIGSASVRHFGWFGISAAELSEELAVLELRREVDRWLAGDGVAWGGAQFHRHFRGFVREHSARCYTSSTSANRVADIPYPPFRTVQGFRIEFLDEAERRSDP